MFNTIVDMIDPIIPPIRRSLIVRDSCQLLEVFLFQCELTSFHVNKPLAWTMERNQRDHSHARNSRQRFRLYQRRNNFGARGHLLMQLYRIKLKFNVGMFDLFSL